MPKIIFFGMTGNFSISPLETLLAAGVNVCAVIVPAPAGKAAISPRQLKYRPPASSDLPLVNPQLERNILHLAWEHNVPVWEVGRPANPHTLQFLADMQPDVIAVACFPHIFPPALLDLPRHGCLNLHPSLLPTYRGPEPLFWIARNDERVSGITLHFLSRNVDSGDIVAQTRIERPDGISGAELEQQCAQEGAELLLTAVKQLEQGQSLARQPQLEADASYFPFPTRADFVIPTTWSARRAFNFMPGAAQWPLSIEIEDKYYPVRVARSYSNDHTLGQPFVLLGDELWVQMQPGVLRVKI